MFNKKDYYNVAGIEAEEIIDGMNMLHREGAALKYLFRNNNILKKGDTEEDLKKCLHYLNRCLQFKPLIRDNNADYYLEYINSSVFDSRLYAAIEYLIKAVGSYDDSYASFINKTIDNVTRYLSES